MAQPQAHQARARTDASDRLVEAEELIAGLQFRCGGQMPGVIASPPLLELVRKSRVFSLRMARPLKMLDESEQVVAWVEVGPDPEGDGCLIGLSNWQTNALPPESLTDGEERRNDIDRQLAELVARLDPQQNILAVEADAVDLAGVLHRMKEGTGRPWTDFVTVQGAAHAQPMHWRLLDGAWITLEGSSRHWTAHFTPLGGPQPGAAGFELYFVAEEAPPEVPRLTEADKAKDKGYSATIGRDVAPVLRQPIARIIANAETIRSCLAGPLAEEYSNYAGDIAASGEHLLALIDDLSDLEVVESDNFTAAPDKIDLGEAARRAVSMLLTQAQDKSIRIDAPRDDEIVPAIGELRRVLQILLNLISNAIRYSPEESQIWIRIEEDGGRSRITVADQGQGISEADQKIMFDKFERLGRSNDGGTGLGLYISRRLARAMNGELSVESTPGAGARFTLELPSGD